jgi:hypothetical protein
LAGRVDDAPLAATAEKTGWNILTQHVRHYRMPDLVVEQGW